MGLAFTILVVELARGPGPHLAPILNSYGYLVITAHGLVELLASLSHPIDLVILDLPSPSELPQLQAIQPAIACPVIVIGPAQNQQLMVAALEQGAADYVQRPFHTDELVARVRAQLRRHERGLGASLTFGPLTIDPQERQATHDGLALELSPEEFTLLATLAAQPGYAYPASLLLERIWGRESREDTAMLATAVERLRSLIEPDPTAPTILGGSLSQGYWLGDGARERELNAE